VTGVRATIAEQKALATDVLETKWPSIAKRLRDALATKAIEISSKALSVLVANERLMCHARVMSDIRPVFGQDELNPSACLILHHLKIAFHEHGDYEHTSDMYVTLEHSDLMKMRDVIDRALQKHEKLVELAKKSDTPVLSFNQDEHGHARA
jgi:hypothetical protein